MRIATSRAALLLVLTLVGAPACRLTYKGGATAVSPNDLGTEWLRAAPTPIVLQQRRNDCGLAALAMVAGAWGRRWSVTDSMRHLVPTDNGVKLGALRDLARARGLEAYAVRGHFEDLEYELGNGRPVLLGLVLPLELEHDTHHYEVAVAIHPRDGTVVTLDPATGEMRKRAKKVLELEWKHAGYATLVVVSDRTRAELDPGTANAPPSLQGER